MNDQQTKSTTVQIALWGVTHTFARGLLLVLIPLLGVPTQAATIEVTSNLDDGSACTLREAIETTNAGMDQSNDCVIDTSTDALGTNDTITFAPAVEGTTIITNGQLIISQSVSINPAGAHTTIDGNQMNRVMFVGGAATTIVSMNQLTITGGNNTGSDGGGIFVGDGASLHLNQSTVSDNSVDNSVAGLFSRGGGIYALDSTLTLTQSTVSGNSSTRDGGGIHALNSTVTLTQSTVSGNSATRYSGGIIAHTSSVNLTQSTVSGNSSTDSGGIHAYSSTVNLTQSTVSGNSSTRDGGGISAYFQSTVTLTQSTVSGNSAGRDGGGIIAHTSTVTLTQSTVSGNSAGRDEGGINAFNSSVTLTNSIVANSTGGDCFIGLSLVNIGADSIIEDGSCSTLVQAVDPLLGPLVDNGGPTLTHALLSGSPAIRSGGRGGETDQRGFVAVDDRDIGAYEFNAVDPLAFDPLTLVNRRWTMVGLSKDALSKTVQDVFVTPTGLASADYNTKWVVYKRDESTDSYVLMSLTDTMEQGKGYWVLQITGADLDFAPDGVDTPVNTSDPNCPSDLGCFEIDLVEGDGKYNLISHPFTHDVKWEDVRIVVNGSLNCSDPYNFIEDAFWNYNGSSYDSFSSMIPMPGGGVFEAYKGYWVKMKSPSLGEDVRLLIPKGPVSGSCVPPVVTFNESPTRPSGQNTQDLPWWLSWVSSAQAAEDTTLKRGEWWVRLQAQSDEDGGMLDQYNYVGWFNDSKDGKDRRDLVELPSFGSPYLTIAFPHDDWDEDSGEYSTDLRKRKYWRLGEEWDFIVKSDKVGREVTISWEGYHQHRRFWIMRLIDVESGKTVRTVYRRQLQSYTFITQSKAHRFKWVQLERPKP